MNKKYKKIVILILLLSAISITIFYLIPKSEVITLDEFKLTVPFKVVEIDSEDKMGTAYRNKKYNMNYFKNITEVIIQKSDISIDEFNSLKIEWLETKDFRNFGNIYSSYNGYEIVYQFADAGPTKYILYLHIFNSNSIYRIVTRNLYSYDLLKIIESIEILANVKIN